MPYWMYVGYNTEHLPKEILTGKKLNKLDIKEHLKNIVTESGILPAQNEETLVRLLITKNIYPIKIRIAKKYDIMIYKLKNAKSKLSTKTN
jgi:hypothetical protein